MKSHNFLIPALLFFSCSTALAKEIVLDKIIARVNGRNILKSHLEEPRMIKDSQPFTFDELITDEVVIQKSEEMGTAPSAADLEATFNSEKIAYGGNAMSDEAFEQTRLKKLGLTLNQYRAQLYRYLATEYLIGALVAKKLVIPAQDIESYYNQHPNYLEEQFHIMIADVSDSKTRPASIKWKDLGWFEMRELSEEFRKIIPSLKPGQASSKPIKYNDKLQLVLLKGHRPRRLEPLSGRYNEIKNKLRDERREPFVKTFVADAKNRAYITFP